MKTLLFLTLSLFLVSTTFANEQEALSQFKKRFAQTEKSEQALLKEFGPPQERYTDKEALQKNIQKALDLKYSQEKPYLLQTQIKTDLTQVDSVWTYDYYGFGKWASFFGIYFDKEGNVIGQDWRIPKQTLAPYNPKEFFQVQLPQNNQERVETFLAWPFSFIRGAKQIACELSKAPINFFEVSLYLGPKAGWQAAQQKIRTSETLIRYFFLNKSKQNPGRAIQELICEIPLIGSWFDHKAPEKLSQSCDAYFLLGGIHQVNDHAQRMDPLELFLKEQLQTDRVYQVPWNYGTMMDVGYNTLNLSSGDALMLAQKIKQRGQLKPGDTIALFAHSGAVQQIIAIARILRDHDIYVSQAFGVAGVFIGGKAPIPNFEIIYNPDLDRFKWLLGFQFLTPGIQWKEVRGKDASKGHEISGSIDKKTRLLYDGYFEEIGLFFETTQDK